MSELAPADRKRRLAAIKDVLKDADSEVGRHTWRWGAHLKEVQDNELWREDGAESFTAWCDWELAMSRRAAGRAIALVEHFTEAMATRFGARKLAAALVYMELTGKIEKPGDVLALEIRYRGPDGRFTSVPFVTAKVRHIEHANRTLRDAAAARADEEREAAIDAEVRAQLAALEKLLPEAPAGTVRGERVQVRKGKDGTLALTIQGIPLADWAEYQAYRRARAAADD